jgi:hypothetical protein
MKNNRFLVIILGLLLSLSFIVNVLFSFILKDFLSARENEKLLVSPPASSPRVSSPNRPPPN